MFWNSNRRIECLRTKIDDQRRGDDQAYYFRGEKATLELDNAF